MKIVIIIPILNPKEEFFTKIVPMLKNQSVKSRIVLINSGKKIEDSLGCDIIDIDKKEFNHANTRNIALNYEADFYLFMTQDSLPFDKYLIEELLKPFDDEDVVISYARQIPYKNTHITEQFARNTNYPTLSCVKSKKDIPVLGIKTYFASNSCAMYLGDYFRKVGGFKKDLNCSEDMEFAFRAIRDNKKVAYSANAKVYHSHIYTCKSLYNRYKKIGEFFCDNYEIEDSIKEFCSTERTGFLQVLQEFTYILKNEPVAIFRSFLFTCIKFVAFKIGRR